MKASSLIYLLLMLLLYSCSKYTIDEGSGSGMDVHIKFQESASGDTFEMEFPVRVFCTDIAGANIKDVTFRQGDEITFPLAKGEYGINVFVGWDENNYTLKDKPDGKQMVTMKNSSMAEKALRAAHTSLEIDRQTDINMIPAYVVASAEVELSNIPADVKSVRIDIFPVSSGYNTCGGYSEDTQSGVIECYEKSGKWVSDKRYFFPVENRKTTISVSIDKGDETDNYSYTFIDGMKAGQPYKFTGGYSDGLNMDGDFQISGWNMEKEIVLDFEDETLVGEDEGDIPSYDIETFIVEAIPSADVIWGPFYVWKVEEQSANEALVTIISPDQWFQKFEEGEALKILNAYDVEGITGWRTFTRAEAEEFHKEYSNYLEELNPFLQENGLDVFYTSNDRRYLCENGEYAFNIFGSTNIRKAGTTVKYYLRPIKTIRLKAQK